MQTAYVDLNPGSALPVLHTSQNDAGRQFKILLYEGDVPYSPPVGSVVSIEGQKYDGHGFAYEVDSFSGNEVTFTTTAQMCAAAGNAECEIRVRAGSGNIGTGNFILAVERSPVTESTDMSETDVPLIVNIATAQMEAAIAAAEAADKSAILSQSWAIGGTGARTGEDTNNSEYYAGQAAGNAGAAAASKTAAETAQGKAEVARAAAETAQGKAETAQAAAETAQGKAEAARTGAETAQEKTTAAQMAAETAQGKTETAQTAAETAQGKAEAAQEKAEEAQAAAETAQAAAENAQASAEDARDAAAGSADGAAASALSAARDADSAEGFRDLAESYAHGQTGKRTGEDEDNAMYYSGLSRSYYNNAKAQADRAEQYADFVTPHFQIANNRLYIRNDAVAGFLVRYNRLYVKIAAA